MPTKRDPCERSSTDESLRSERARTDAELAQRTSALHETTTDVVTEERDTMDGVLHATREREDQRTGRSPKLTRERALDDAVVRTARRGADAIVRDEVEQARVALASLLAFEREDTDLQLAIERRRADQLLASREDFMAMVSHDLRGLLGGIALSAELLKEAPHHPEPLAKVAHHADRIQRLTARMSRLVGDLVDVASIEAHKLSLARQRYDVGRLLRDAFDSFVPAAEAAGVTLTCTAGEELGSVELDHERILQVLGNLVGNALKFTARGGRITIEAERRADGVRISVTDTGPGIPSELLEKIFERYFQAQDGDRRGLGLGLFIARSIIEAHGGSIGATSVQGRGSTIAFTLPAARVS